MWKSILIYNDWICLIKLTKSWSQQLIYLPENVIPTITDRDFVVATVAAPTVIKEPEKPAEAVAEGADGEAVAQTEGAEVKAEQGKDGDAAKKDEKQKDAGGDKKPQAEKKPAEKK